jgi:hypothetical protein
MESVEPFDKPIIVSQVQGWGTQEVVREEWLLIDDERFAMPLVGPIPRKHEAQMFDRIQACAELTHLVLVMCPVYRLPPSGHGWPAVRSDERKILRMTAKCCVKVVGSIVERIV